MKVSTHAERVPRSKLSFSLSSLDNAERKSSFWNLWHQWPVASAPSPVACHDIHEARRNRGRIQHHQTSLKGSFATHRNNPLTCGIVDAIKCISLLQMSLSFLNPIRPWNSVIRSRLDVPCQTRGPKTKEPGWLIFPVSGSFNAPSSSQK